MNKLATIIQYTFVGIVNKIYDPVKALENEQRKLTERHFKGNELYIKSNGELEVQISNLQKLSNDIKNHNEKIDYFLGQDHEDLANKEAIKLAVYLAQYKDMETIISDSREGLRIALEVIKKIETKLQSNELKISNLKTKQQMNKSAKVMLDLLKLDTGVTGKDNFQTVENNITNELHKLNGERKAILTLSSDKNSDNDINITAKSILEERKKLLLSNKIGVEENE